MARWDPVQIGDHALRVREFRLFLDSNVLFPIVPDSMVRPLRQQLIEIEHKLMTMLYDANEIDRIAALRKAFERTDR